MWRALRVYGLTAFIISGVWAIGLLKQEPRVPAAIDFPERQTTLASSHAVASTGDDLMAM